MMAKEKIDNDSPFVPAEEQPYPVPENWCWVRLQALYEVNPKINANDNDAAAFIPMEKIQPGMISSFEFEIQNWGKAKKGHTQFADGDVAFAKISPCFENRKSMMLKGLPNGIGGGTTELIILRNPAILQDYTFWLISTEDFIRKGIATYSGTVGQQRISMNYIRNYPVPLAPYPEQIRIVNRIESLFAKLDETKEMVNVSLKSFELRKSAILHKAFSGELTSAWRSNRNIDEPWVTTNLSQVVSEFKYGTSEKSTYDGSGMPVLRIPNIADGSITFEDIKYLSHTDIPEENQIHENDILIIRSNGSRELVGKSALVPSLPTSYAYASFLIRIRSLDNILPKYLVMYLNSSDARNQMFKKAKSSAGINNINSKELGSITIGLPPLSEQTEIVRILDNFFAREADTKDKLEATLESIETIKKAILAKAFQGELDTNNPFDESAESLLKLL